MSLHCYCYKVHCYWHSVTTYFQFAQPNLRRHIPTGKKMGCCHLKIMWFNNSIYEYEWKMQIPLQRFQWKNVLFNVLCLLTSLSCHFFCSAFVVAKRSLCFIICKRSEMSGVSFWSGVQTSCEAPPVLLSLSSLTVLMWMHMVRLVLVAYNFTWVHIGEGKACM